MKNFFKFFFASCLGSIAAFVAVIIIGTWIMIGAIAGLGKDDKEVKVEPNTVLHMKLNYPIPEKSSNNPLENFDWESMEARENLSLTQLIANIQKAKDDDNIKGIFLDLSVTPNGLATLEALRDELVGFRESGKFIVAYSEVMGQKAYYLASTADEVYLNPVGALDFRGFGSNIMFLKGALDKLEIEPQVIYAGKYKSATEPFRLTEMSEANKEQVKAYIDDVYSHYLTEIGASRDMSRAELFNIADKLLVRQPADAVTHGLADGTKYYDEVLAILADKVGEDDPQDINFLALNKYNKVKAKGKKKKYEKQKIAVIYAEGSIVDGGGADDNIGSTKYAKIIREVRNDEDVKAIVLRVNSPGGSALASEVMYRELKLANEKMPVVVSMGDVAASGGYYIACQSDRIFAEPNTITGSIGVFGILPNMQGFLNNKLGITFDGYNTTEYANMGAIYRPLSENEEEVIQGMIDTIYYTFKSRVAEGRDLDIEFVDSVGRGRVWTGNQALANGLVDELGGLEDAIAFAAEEAGIDKYRKKTYPVKEDPFEKFMKELSGEAEAHYLKKNMGEEQYKLFMKMKEIEEWKGVQARLPYEVEIH